MEQGIQTVTGKFPVDKLNKVLMHEHIVLGYAGWFYDPKCAVFNQKEAEEQVCERLFQLKDEGVNLIVDPCPIELGRNPEFMQVVSEKTKVNIMCSTGFDLQDRGYMSAFRGASANDISEIYLEEIENGIGPAKIKPGIIKVATGYNQITDYEMRCVEAACIASKKTNLPIITHTEKGTMGDEQIRAFKKFGVDPKRCIIGHCCANTDIRYHKSIFDEGCYIGYDRFGNKWHGDDYFRLATLTALVHAGFSDRLFLGTDSVAYLLKAFPQKRDTSDWTPMYLFRYVIPELKKRGVSQEAIDNMMSNNAKRFFKGE